MCYTADMCVYIMYKIQIVSVIFMTGVLQYKV